MRHDRGVAKDVEAEQIAYYRARAPEYDADLYGSPETPALLAEVIERVPRGGDLLELACGTGIWTRQLVARAASVTAVDASPEMIEIARQRAPQARFVCANLFDWQAPRHYDVIFFGFWLSHVPLGRFDSFWAWLRDALADDGRIVFVDEHLSNAGKETWLAEDVVRRRLRDGSTHRVIKAFLDPDPLVDRLSALGWQADVRPLGHGWVVGVASPGP